MAISLKDTVAVVGAGTMGAGIAQVAAAAGHEVLLFDSTNDAAGRGIDRIANGLSKLVERGKYVEDDKTALLARIHVVESLEQLATARIVIEAIIENLDAKRELLVSLESLCGDDTILATNTSSISVTAIGAALEHPRFLIGIHFFNPAPVMKLVEIVSGMETDAAVAQDVFDLAVAWKKIPVHARSTPGFIVNRVARPFYGEALRLLQEGAASVATIDAGLRDCGGFRMGPFELMDLIGIDVNFAVTQSIYHGFYEDPRYRPSIIQEEMVEGGRHGKKTGRGFYRYDGSEAESAAEAGSVEAPKSVTLAGNLGTAQGLAAAIKKAGLKLEITDGPGVIMIPGATLALSDGRSATSRSVTDGLSDLVVFDLARDYENCPRIVLAVSEQADERAMDSAAGFVQALGKTASFVEDVPGLIVMRTVCMLSNEAVEAVMTGVCSADDLDKAMTLGVNYPQGPLTWADEIGLQQVLKVIDALACNYCEDRYRASTLLRRKVAGGTTLYG